MLGGSQNFLFVLLLSVAISGCGKKSDIQDAKGSVQVQIGIQTSPNEYSLQKVYLSGITNLQEVSGSFVKFFFAPGSENDYLIGSAPRAHFIKTSNFFVPTDLISMQMATIYYHIQNLAAFDNIIGAGGINKWPRQVGIETQIMDNKEMRRNNAFYNGQTDSMMFVPYTKKELPIAMNAGIIAHEHFHSLFFKVVISPALQAKKLLTNSASIHTLEVDRTIELSLTKIRNQGLTATEKAQLFNETYLRGLNEGLADFWGWVYTDDAEFMRWSLPSFQEERSLQLEKNQMGDYQTNEDLNKMIALMVESADDVRSGLGNYAYLVGTPYARFLKHLTGLQIQNKNIPPQEAKAKVAQLAFQYMQTLGSEFVKTKDKDTLHTGGLFNFIAQRMENNHMGLKLNDADCEFLGHYINKEIEEEQKIKACEDFDSLEYIVE